MLRTIICLVRGNDRLTAIVMFPVTGESYSFTARRKEGYYACKDENHS